MSLNKFVCFKTLRKHAEQNASCRCRFDYSGLLVGDLKIEFPSTGSLYTGKTIPKRRVAIVIAQSNKSVLLGYTKKILIHFKRTFAAENG